MILVGDCIERMAELDAASVDAIVTDPPYGLEFMGKEWDKLSGQPGYVERGRMTPASSGLVTSKGFAQIPNSFQAGRPMQAWHEAWATKALRVLKPGGHLLACAVEDAGFEIRDTIAWLYGTGFPKSRNIGDGWGTALKPAHEPIVVARKPLVGTVAANVLAHGTGAINVDGCRVGFRNAADEAESKDKNRHADYGSGEVVGYHGWESRAGGGNYDPEGRWPANVVLDPEAAALLDEQAGPRQPGASPAKRGLGSGRVYGDADRAGVDKEREQLDGGGASRFFYCAKSSRAERNAGLDGFEERASLKLDPTSAMAHGGRRGSGVAANHHPTVKPIALMRWLTRLVTPPDGLVLDPFAGSGTTGCAAALEGFRFLGIERDEEYARIAEARIAYWAAQPTQLELAG